MTVATWFRSHRWSVWIVTLLAAVVVGCSAPGNVAAAGSNATTAPMTVMATTQSSVGLVTIQENELPTQARKTLKLIDSGGPFPFSRDGIVYHNNSGALPHHKDGWYHEYTVATPGAQGRGPRRIVCGSDSTCFWTPDHYSTFKRIIR